MIQWLVTWLEIKNADLRLDLNWKNLLGQSSAMGPTYIRPCFTTQGIQHSKLWHHRDMALEASIGFCSRALEGIAGIWTQAWTQLLSSSDHLHVAAEDFGATWRSFTWAYQIGISEDTLRHGGIIILVLTWYICSAHEITTVFSSRWYTFRLKSNYDSISSGSEFVTVLISWKSMNSLLTLTVECAVFSRLWDGQIHAPINFCWWQ